MECILLPYGNTGWTERCRILEETIVTRSGTPLLYNDVLVLVPSSRMKRVYGRLLLDLAERQGSSALVPPEFLTLPQFLEMLHALRKGPRIIDENCRLVLLEGLVKERLLAGPLFGQSPDLLAPSLSAALAKTVEQLSAAGVSPGDLALNIQDAEFFDKPQVRLLIDVYTRYAAVLKARDLTDPADLRARLRDSFDPSWLTRYSRIIIDGIQHAGKLDAELLKIIASAEGCLCLVDAPSLDLLDRAGEDHPLGATKAFLSDLGLTPRQGRTTPEAADLFLSRALFSDETFEDLEKTAPSPAAFGKDVRLLSAINTREEVSLIAGMVKQSLQRGAEPEHILVAFPALDEYAPLVEEIFLDYGIPYNRALGRQLSASPVATAVISLLRACQEDFSGPSLLRIFSAPFLKFGEDPALAPALDRFLRRARITGGKEKLLTALSALPPGKDDSLLPGQVRDLFAALGPFAANNASPLSLWMERLAGLISWAGLPARVDKIHGPLNTNLQAYNKLRGALESLGAAGRLFPEYTYTLDEFLFLLKKTFMHARFQVPPEDEGGVQVLGLEESAGQPWKELYLGGLVDGGFPQRLPQNIFLPERTLEAMGVRTLEKARLGAAHHFYRLLQSARSVVLTWPENQGDRPAAPSPFLHELTPLLRAGLLNRGIGKTSGIQLSLKIEESRSVQELAKAMVLSGKAHGARDALNAGLDGLQGIRAALAAGSAGPSLPAASPGKREFRVTELDEYLACPYKYSVTHVLRLRPLQEATEDLSPADRGSKAHAILRDFYLFWKGPVTGEKRSEAKALLTKLAETAFDREADTFRNRRDREFFLSVMSERFLDAEEEFWRRGMRPAYLERRIEDFRLVLSNGETASLTAKIDRIDVAPDGDFVIVDYKTGAYPLPKMTAEQDIFQLPVYAVMALRALSMEGNAPLRKAVGLAYYDLSGKNRGPARDVVLFNKEARDDHTSSKPKASPRSERDFEELLKQSLDKARAAIEGILAGEFPSKPRDENACGHCEHAMLCRATSVSSGPARSPGYESDDQL